MGGVPSIVNKMTGNALWGRFALMSGQRTVVDGDVVAGRKQARLLSVRATPFPGHDLAETVSGRVRAKLARTMLQAGERLLSAHTDGVWVEGELELDGWRPDKRARRIDLLQPACLRWWPNPHGGPRVVYAGQPRVAASAAFEKAWSELQC